MLLRDAEGSHLAFEPEGQGALARSAGVDQLLRADPYENLLLNSQAMHL
jgi:hypothetical protein